MNKKDYTILKERAINSIDLLFNIWGIEYTKIGNNEYDFISPTRPNDEHFGACRFNIAKGVGADFAGISFGRQDFEQIGKGFSKEDFSGFSQYGETKTSFDIIGLAQRIYNSNSYSEAASKLKEDLDKIDGGKINLVELLEQIAIRDEKQKLEKEKIKRIANKRWEKSKSIVGTIGEKYLNSRCIYIQEGFDEPNVKFHPQVFNKELNIFIPALLFKVSRTIDSDLEAVHRIWIAKDGSRKARLEESKKALGSIQGNAIWLGKKDKELFICEGPEDALHLLCNCGVKLVACTVYANNFHCIHIPEYVETIYLVPDIDKAGIEATKKSYKAYFSVCPNIKIIDVRKRQL